MEQENAKLKEYADSNSECLRQPWPDELRALGETLYVEQEKTEVLIPSKPSAAVTTPPVCVTQRENTPEETKQAATHYRTVCIPYFLERWEIFVGEVDAKWDWMFAERDRRITRNEEQEED